MRTYLTYAIGIALMVLFAYMTSYYPQMLSTLFFVYIVAVLGITFLLTGKSAARMVRDIEYISKGKRLFSARKETINKLKILDAEELSRELRGQSTFMAIYFLPMILVLALIFIPGIRDAIIGSLEGLFGDLAHDKHLARFIAYLTFYSLFYVVSLSSMVASKVVQRKYGGMLMVPQSYVVTDRGLILDERTPIKFPLTDAKVSINEKRNFVEIELKSAQQPTGGVVRYRLYTRQPRVLYDILRERLAEQR